MGIMRKTLLERLRVMFPSAKICSTYGYITKYWREKRGIEKTHVSDAFVVTKNLDAERLEKAFLIVPKRQHNRQIHKCKVGKGGVRKLNQTPKYVFGVQLFDKVKVIGYGCGQVGFVFGRRSSGYFDIRTLDGEKISAGISCTRLRLLESRKVFLIS